jgi:protein gp37
MGISRSRRASWSIPASRRIFFLEDADAWRKEAWDMIRMRDDLSFFLITKRIHRFSVSLPADWGEGYPHISIATTVENQDRANFRMPMYLAAPIRHKSIVCEPLLERIDLSPYLSDAIEHVTVGGESGNEARVCRYEWVLDIGNNADSGASRSISKKTGALFEKDGHTFRVPANTSTSRPKRQGLICRND